VSQSKSILRLEAKSRRADLARAVPDFAQRIAGFANQLNIRGDAIVAGYWPVRDEADPRGLMKALGTALALPRIDAKHTALSFREWRDGDVLVDNHHGIPEPRAGTKILTPDVVLVPLLAFDARGHRLGYGGGYYDRTLSSLGSAALAIGVAYSAQRLDHISHEAHDRKLDLIITEYGIQDVGT
jgi:5-formyltetrahydrofolate cyclo-ligase